MIIDQEFKSLNRKLNESEYKKLEASIIQEGVRDPLVLWNEILIDGHNRLDIATKHNISYSTINNNDLADREEVKTWIINNQLGRRNLTPNEVSYYRGKLYESLKRQGERSDITSGQNVHKSTSEEMAEKYGVSEKTIRRDAEFSKAVDRVEAEAGIDIKDAILSGKANVPKKNIEDVIKIKQEAPEYVEPIMQGEITITKAKREIAKEKRKNMPKPELPIGTYEVIYADPPWSYDNSGFTQSAASQYPTMSIEEICNLDVSALTNNRSVLFMWATSPLLPEAFEVIKAWGFEYKASMVWIKDRSPGMGWWVNTKHELLLMASKPSAEKVNHPAKKFDSVITAPVTRHSAKPDVFYKLIEEMYDGTKIELFARNKREGWDNWGNENV